MPFIRANPSFAFNFIGLNPHFAKADLADTSLPNFSVLESILLNTWTLPLPHKAKTK